MSLWSSVAIVVAACPRRGTSSHDVRDSGCPPPSVCLSCLRNRGSSSSCQARILVTMQVKVSRVQVSCCGDEGWEVGKKGRHRYNAGIGDEIGVHTILLGRLYAPLFRHGVDDVRTPFRACIDAWAAATDASEPGASPSSRPPFCSSCSPPVYGSNCADWHPQ
eukprot:COSAG02_NODE_6772_length_3369_cov_3.718043_5_plen_163_part_00